MSGTDGDGSSQRRRGLVLLIPFLLIGVVLAGQAIRLWLGEDTVGGLAATVGAFLFLAIPLGILAVIRSVGARWRRTRSVRQAHPDQPWLWREDWAARRVTDGGAGETVGLFIFTGLWNLIAFPAGYLVWRGQQVEEDPGLWLVMIFPGIGAILLLAAVVSLVRRLKYGWSTLELATLPAPLGHMLGGMIRTGRVLQPPGGFRLALAAVRRVTTGSGKNRSTREIILYQDERSIPGGSRRESGLAIPFLFPIPPDAPPTDTSNARDEVLWRLTVSASVPGLDYSARFDVPVFRTAESDRPLSADEIARLVPDSDPDRYRQPEASPILVTERGRELVIVAPPLRNANATITVLVFAMVWLGILYPIVLAGAPAFFVAILGLIAVGMVVGALYSALLKLTLRAEPGRLRIERELVGLARLRGHDLRRDEVVRVEATVAGSGDAAAHQLAVVRPDGTSLIAMAGIPERREAEWLATRVMAAVGVSE